jgi:3-hydroxyisobutyrate dehydrogenase-like beta-hydroxyacid dehydrogenase
LRHLQTLAFSEGLLLAEQEGLDVHLAATVMAESQIGSPMLKLRVPLILDPPDEAWFDIGLMHKDVRLARQAAAEHGTPLPTAGVADDILSQAEQLGYTHRDIAALHALLARLTHNTAAGTS